MVPSSGKVLTGGVDANAAAAAKAPSLVRRATSREGGSLTIIATALIDTGFAHGRGHLRGIQRAPATRKSCSTGRLQTSGYSRSMDILKSGTRKEDLLVPKQDLQKIFVLRRDSGADGNHGCDRVPDRQAEADQDQQRFLRFDEHLTTRSEPPIRFEDRYVYAGHDLRTFIGTAASRGCHHTDIWSRRSIRTRNAYRGRFRSRRRATRLSDIERFLRSVAWDQGIVVFFPGPRSFTGEDVAELQIHG